MKPLLLALDTATRAAGLALYDGTRVLSESIWSSKDHHTVELAPSIAETLAKCGLRSADLGAVAVSLGPGSFTGLRIGLAVAKGLVLAQRLALVGVPTLDILAAAQPVLEIPLAAVLQAGRGRLAVSWYRASGEHLVGGEHLAKGATWQSIGPVEALSPEELSERIQNPTLVCGELTEDERRLLGRKRKNVLLASPATSLRRPSFLAELAWGRWQAGDVDDPATLAPIYLHYNEPIPG